MARRQCEVEWCDRPAQPKKKLCATHLGLHDPTPEHHVARVRTCLRCGEPFPSSWAGDRRCPTCREQLHRAELEALKRGHTPVHYMSPFEPAHTPGIAE